jgi:hypothetical protein
VGLPEVVLSRFCSYAARIPSVSIGPFFKLASALPGVVTVSCDDTGRDGNINPSMVIRSARIGAGQSLWVRGWLYRDRDGVAKHKSAIREFFSPAPEIQLRVDDCIRQNREENTVLIGVHLRRGDYRTWAGGRYYYDDNAFRGLMQRMAEVLPDRRVRFLLVSDQSIDQDSYSGLDSALGPGDPVGDLYCLAACDYLMGPPSTFTIWASFFGDVPLYTIEDPSECPRLDSFTVCAG